MRKAWVMTMVAAALALSGCSRIKQSQGYLMDETLITSIQPGVDNRESVAKTLGRPTFASEFDPGSWYYISRVTGQYAFVRPRTQSQAIVVVKFDEAGNVTGVERRGMENIVSIAPSKDKTPTLGREESLLQELFGNIGAVGSAGGPIQGGPTGRDGPR